MNLTKHVTTDNIDIPPPAQAGPWAIAPHQPRATWDVVAARGAVGILAGVVAWWLLPPAAAYAALSIGAAAAIKRWVLTDQVAGVQIWTWRNDASSREIVGYLGQAAVEHARRELPNVSSYSPSVQQAPARRGEVVDGQVVDAPAQLAAPINIGPIAIPDWLTALDQQPHAIFAAKTKGGKSTMAKVGLKRRVDRGEDVFIIDPHSNGWLDLPAVGGGLNWPEIELAMLTVLAVYRERMAEREAHMRETGRELPHDYFPRLTVVFDEANESRTMIESRHKPKTNPWPLFLEVMGSGARKVGISLWLICQSALIKNLGGSSVMRRNFSVFALDHATIAELIEDEEPIKARREIIVERLSGAPYPAATVLNGQAFLLDRAGLDQLVPPSAADCAWGGWDYTQRRPRNMAPARTLNQSSARPVERASIAPPAPALRQDRMELYLKALVRQRKTRREIRAWCQARGLRFDNDLLTRVRSDLGLSVDRS